MHGEDVLDEVRHVEEDRILRIARAVGVESEHLVVVRLVSLAVPFLRGDAPQLVPRGRFALDDAGVVARLRRADDVVVRRRAAVVARGVVVVHALLGLVESPVDAVDEEVVVAAAVVRLAHRALGVAREAFVDERVAVFVVRPGVVLGRTEVDLLEFVGAFVAEQRMLQRAHAVLAAEEEAERVLRMLRAAAERAADAQSRRNGELVRRVHRIDLLDHRLALPDASVARRVHVDAARAVEHALRVDHERHGARVLGEAAPQALARIGVALRDSSVESVAHRLVVDLLVRREALGHGRILRNHVLVEEIRRGHVVLENRVDVRYSRAHDRGLLDVERFGVAVGRRRADDRRGAVERVIYDRRIVVRAGKREVERRVLPAVRLAERHLGREARASAAAVRRARRGRREVDEHVLGHVVDEFRREVELGVADRVVLRRDLKDVDALYDEQRIDNERLRPERFGGGTRRICRD